MDGMEVPQLGDMGCDKIGGTSLFPGGKTENILSLRKGCGSLRDAADSFKKLKPPPTSFAAYIGLHWRTKLENKILSFLLKSFIIYPNTTLPCAYAWQSLNTIASI